MEKYNKLFELTPFSREQEVKGKDLTLDTFKGFTDFLIDKVSRAIGEWHKKGSMLLKDMGFLKENPFNKAIPKLELDNFYVSYNFMREAYHLYAVFADKADYYKFEAKFKTALSRVSSIHSSDPPFYYVEPIDDTVKRDIDYSIMFTSGIRQYGKESVGSFGLQVIINDVKEGKGYHLTDYPALKLQKD